MRLLFGFRGFNIMSILICLEVLIKDVYLSVMFVDCYLALEDLI